MAAAMPKIYSVPAAESPYVLLQPWDKPLTQRQAYWLDCLMAALARRMVGEPKGAEQLPVSLLEIRRIDRERNGGTHSSIPTNVITDILQALSYRKWIRIGEMPLVIRNADRRCSTKAYLLADRTGFATDAQAIMDIQKAMAKAQLIEAHMRGNIRAGIAIQEDYEARAKAQKEIAEYGKRIDALRANLSRQFTETDAAFIYELPSFHEQLLTLTVPTKPEAPRTTSPYSEESP